MLLYLRYLWLEYALLTAQGNKNKRKNMNTAIEYFDKTAEDNSAFRPLRKGEAEGFAGKSDDYVGRLRRNMRKTMSDGTRPLRRGEAQKWDKKSKAYLDRVDEARKTGKRPARREVMRKRFD